MRKNPVVSENDTGAGEHKAITLQDKGKEHELQKCSGDADKDQS